MQAQSSVHYNITKTIYNLLLNATQIPMYNTAFMKNTLQITISETKCSVYCTGKVVEIC